MSKKIILKKMSEKKERDLHNNIEEVVRLYLKSRGLELFSYMVTMSVRDSDGVSAALARAHIDNSNMEQTYEHLKIADESLQGVQDEFKKQVLKAFFMDTFKGLKDEEKEK